jgi:uncharacterized phage-associated protein
MYNLTFEFSIEKLVHGIAFFSNSGIQDLTKLKVAKLFYFADKAHLLAHGTPIIGDVYWCMDWGPVPSFALNEMNEALGRPEITFTEDSDATLFASVLNVKRSLWTNAHPRFEAKNSNDPNVFSKSEIEVLGKTASIYGFKSAGQLVDLTHQEPPWTIANKNRNPGTRALITYDLFFYGAPEASQRLLAKLVADQYGVAISLRGDADYTAFARELSTHDFAPDEVSDLDIRSRSRYSRS